MNSKLVAYSDYTKELERIDKELEKETMDSGIDVVSLYKDGHVMDGYEYPIELGIVWPSFGSTPLKDAERFADNIKKAVEICESFKYTGYYIDYLV